MKGPHRVSQTMFLILTPTAFEQQALRDALGAAESRTFAHRNQVQGLLADRTVVLLETGIGAVNTAQALTAVLQASRPVLVLQIGGGGAYLSSGLGIGDLAIATEENYGDLGVLTPDGWQPADVIGIPVLQKDRDYFNRFPLRPALVARAKALVRNIPWDAPAPQVRSGPFITVQQCSGRASAGNELAARFNGICENMEGAAAAHLCMLYGVPFLELRGISNRVEDRSRETWDLNLAANRAQQAARALVESLDLKNPNTPAIL